MTKRLKRIIIALLFISFLFIYFLCWGIPYSEDGETYSIPSNNQFDTGDNVIIKLNSVNGMILDKDYNKNRKIWTYKIRIWYAPTKEYDGHFHIDEFQEFELDISTQRSNN